MNLPIMEEIVIHDFEVQTLIKKLKEAKLGQGPRFIDVQLRKKDSIEKALDNIITAIEVVGINPRLPYPLYIINPLVKNFMDLPILNSKKDLPSHFSCKTARMNSKEQSLLKKTNLLAKRISNNEIEDILAHISSDSNARRYLSETCQENDFLESVLDGLQRPSEALKAATKSSSGYKK